jgi:hypothetical protein
MGPLLVLCGAALVQLTTCGYALAGRMPAGRILRFLQTKNLKLKNGMDPIF